MYTKKRTFLQSLKSTFSRKYREKLEEKEKKLAERTAASLAATAKQVDEYIDYLKARVDIERKQKLANIRPPNISNRQLFKLIMILNRFVMIIAYFFMFPF